MTFDRYLRRRILHFTRHDAFGGKKKFQGYIELEPDPELEDETRFLYSIRFPENPFWDQQGWGEFFKSGRNIHDRHIEEGPYLHLVGKNRQGNVSFDLKLCLVEGGKSIYPNMKGAGAGDEEDHRDGQKRGGEEIQIGGTYDYEGYGDGTGTNAMTASTNPGNSDGDGDGEPPVIHPPW